MLIEERAAPLVLKCVGLSVGLSESDIVRDEVVFCDVVEGVGELDRAESAIEDLSAEVTDTLLL